MQLIRRGRDLILNPKVHHRTLIWLHGLGDSAEGFLPLFQTNHLFENCRIVLLTAPIRPVSLNYGMEMNSWYDIVSIETREMNKEVVESAEIVSNEIKVQKTDSDFIILGGFSQGGALSLYTGLAHINSPVNGIIGVSSYAMDYKTKPALQNTPVLLYHGRNDLTVTLDMAQTSYQRFLKDIKYKFVTEEGLGHGISLQVLQEIKAWVKNL